jgi:cyclase
VSARSLHWALWVGALLSGCGLGVFLRVEPVQVAPGIRASLGGGGNSTILQGGGDAFVVDLKFGDFARRLRREVEQDLGREVRRILLSHSHTDHAGGLELYPDVRAVLAHPRSIARLKAKAPGTPWIEVEKEIQVSLGGRHVRALFVGPGHTDGDLIAFVPEEKVLVAGDLWSNGFEPFIDSASGGTILGMRAALERMLELPFEKVVPGHGEVGTRADVQKTRDYLLRLETAVAELKQAGKTEAAVVAALGNPEPGFRAVPFLTNRERNVRLMYQALSEGVRE